MKTLRRVLPLGTALFLWIPACTTSSDASSAKKKCNALLEQFCDSLVECAVQGGLIDDAQRDSEHADCLRVAGQQVSCSNAVDVSSNYDDCMSRLKNPPCDDVNQQVQNGTLELPSSCDGVILTK